MLELRPTCEHCNKDLPPDSTEAMICSYECTFCSSCAINLFENVCPNCGGGFVSRPNRPSQNLKNGNFLGQHSASKKIVHSLKTLSDHKEFALKIKSTPSHKR